MSKKMYKVKNKGCTKNSIISSYKLTTKLIGCNFCIVKSEKSSCQCYISLIIFHGCKTYSIKFKREYLKYLMIYLLGHTYIYLKFISCRFFYRLFKKFQVQNYIKLLETGQFCKKNFCRRVVFEYRVTLHK